MANIVVQRSNNAFIGEIFDPYSMLNMNVLESSPTRWFGMHSGSTFGVFEGSNLTHYPGNVPSGGVINLITYEDRWGAVEISGLSYSAESFFNLMISGGTDRLLADFYGGNDRFQGSSERDNLRAFGGDDSLAGGGGNDVLAGGDGNDTVSGGMGADVIRETAGANYLRGDEGDDSISGGANFDDINGNTGNDTGSGGDGDDWVVGGKDNDSLSGGGGNDLVYGNLGDDTISGDGGNDIVRGGQQNDVLMGGAGDDYISGDRGGDTVSGGAGADIFHTFSEAGIDRVTDFSLAEGDQVQVDPGTQYVVGQVGGDTVVTIVGGGQMVLVGVQMSSLTPGWIFGA